MKWETDIGLEVHAELATESKLFCACSTAFGGSPNTRCCPVCLGFPGTLPRLNGRAVEYAAKAAMLMHCTLAPVCRFDRKNYFYPDLPKAYQITQFFHPIGRDGYVEISTSAGMRRIRIADVHLEEDAGKLLHDRQTGQSVADFNRSGIPLIEIVTCPDFSDENEVLAFLEELRLLLLYPGLSDCKMQEGSLRVDVNLSVRSMGTTEPGERTEMKNLSSLRAIARAIRGERARQCREREADRPVLRQTRRWDEETEESFPLREKETRGEYRYFPEPDIPPYALPAEQLERWRQQLPPTAAERRERYCREYALTPAIAGQLLTDPAMADLFEQAVALCGSPAALAYWLTGEVTCLLREAGQTLSQTGLTPRGLAGVVALTEAGRVSRQNGRILLRAAMTGETEMETLAEACGLWQTQDDALLSRAVASVLAENPEPVRQYLAGKEKVLAFLVGQGMRALSGKADATALAAEFRKQLGEKA